MSLARLALVVAAAVAVAAPAAEAASRPAWFAVGNARASEGGTKLVFVIRRAAATGVSSVGYSTAARTATAADFRPVSGRLVFAPGQTRRRVVVTLRHDTRDEPAETLAFRLTAPRGGRIARGRAIGTIEDDDPPPPSPPASVVRFAAVGDTGRGNEGQYAVARALHGKCAEAGCDYVLALGDNIYEEGVTSVADPQFETKFRQPYAQISQPFWMVLGNHDYGSSFEAARAQAQIDYTWAAENAGGKWRLPSHTYRRTDEHVEFFALDTTPAMFGPQPAQATAVAGWLAGSAATWKIALGHHPYRSNGSHGNAGAYEGVPGIGENVKALLDGGVCGKADVYLAGHDHNLQWLERSPTVCGGTELLVSGAGATTKAFNTRMHSPTVFQTDTKLGFLYVVIRDRELTAEFVDSTGTTLFTRTITR
jgi:tartrate-resistant acid phosphatase type 5